MEDVLVQRIFESLVPGDEHRADKLAAVIHAGQIAQTYVNAPEKLKTKMFPFYQERGATNSNTT